jgi:hypothetical protein
LRDTNLLDLSEEIDICTKLENLNFQIPENILALIRQAEEVKVTISRNFSICVTLGSNGCIF